MRLAIYQIFFTLLAFDSEASYEVIEALNESEVRWMIQPNGQGDLKIAILSGLEPEPVSLDTVKFFMYSRENPTDPEVRGWNASCPPVFKHFNPQRRTKVLIHGYGDSWSTSLMYPLLREAYLETGDYNVMEVDWSELAATPWYLTASRNTDRVGHRVATMINHLVRSTGAKLKDVHIVGFSLGAHVAGAAGRSVKAGNVGRITGLDPAQVLFLRTPPEYRLDPTDAELVEVVHTSGGYLGFGEPLGHRDFFPNGGSWPQPGCLLDYAAVCSHRRAYYYFAEDIRQGRGFRGTQCDSYPFFETGMCERNRGRALEMVNDNYDPELIGKFFLDTNSNEPFGRGEETVEVDNNV